MTPSLGVPRLRNWAGKQCRALLDRIDHRPSLIGLIGTVMAISMLIGVALLLRADRQTRYLHALERAQSVASVVAASLGGNFAVYDALLKEMVREAEDLSTPLFPERVRDRVHFGRTLSRDFLDDAYIVDKTGRIAAPLDQPQARSVNVADRDYFRSHEASPSLGLYISQPYASRTHGGTLSVALTRRIAAPDHSFAGVAVLALRLDHLGTLVDEVDSADLRSIDIVEEKGTVLACDPCAGSRPGKLVVLPGDAAPNGDLAAALSFPRGASAKHYRSVRVPGASMYVVVTPSTEVLMREWSRSTLLLGGIALVCAAMLVAGSWLLTAAVRARASAMAQLASLAMTDGLTGLANRKALDARLATEWRRAKRSGSPLSILLVDIDHFLHFNEVHGHSMGDDVLRTVARNIGGHVRRDSDLVARFDGETFVVVLPDTDAHSAAVMAEQVRRDIERLHIDHAGSETGCVTVSVGVATGVATGVAGGTHAKGACDSVAALLKAADAQRFVAKRGGRNRVSAVDLGAGAALGEPGAAGPADAAADGTAERQS